MRYKIKEFDLDGVIEGQVIRGTCKMNLNQNNNKVMMKILIIKRINDLNKNR